MSLCPCVCVSWSYNSRTPSFRDVSDESTRETRTGERALGPGRGAMYHVLHSSDIAHRNAIAISLSQVS